MGCIFYDIFVILVTVAIVVLSYFLWTFKYWKRRGLPYLEPTVPFGNTINPVTRTITIGEIIKRLHDGIKKKGHKHGGK